MPEAKGRTIACLCRGMIHGLDDRREQHAGGGMVELLRVEPDREPDSVPHPPTAVAFSLAPTSSLLRVGGVTVPCAEMYRLLLFRTRDML